MRFNTGQGHTPLDPDEVDGLLVSVSTQYEIDAAEAENMLSVIPALRVSKRVRDDLLSVETLIWIHRRLFGKTWKWAGKIRQTEKSIGIESWKIRTELTNLIEDFKTWKQFETYEPKMCLAKFHHRLVWIHCFVNGNGRHARIVTDLLAGQLNYPQPTWGTLLELNRDDYLTALRSADARDMNPLVHFMFS